MLQVRGVHPEASSQLSAVLSNLQLCGMLREATGALQPAMPLGEQPAPAGPAWRSPGCRVEALRPEDLEGALALRAYVRAARRPSRRKPGLQEKQGPKPAADR